MKLLSASCLLIVSFFSSCERTFEFELPEEKDEIILYAQLSVNTPIRAFLSKSSSIDKPIDFNVESTSYQVILYEFDSVIDTLKWNSEGYYESNLDVFNIAKEYSLKVFSLTGELVVETHSISPMEYSKNIEIVDTKELIKGLNLDLETRKFEVVIDSLQTLSFYSFNAKGIVDGKRTNVSQFFVGSDFDIKSDCSFTLPRTLFFSSKCSNALQQTQEVGIELAIFDSSKRMMIEPDTVIVSVQQMDREWYDYYKTISDPSFIENVFAQPLIFDSNFKKGRGVWAASNLYEETFDLK